MNKIINLSDKRGKIYICDINNYQDIKANLYVLCTTYTSEIPEGVISSDELAPSFSLFLKKKAWIEKGEFRDRFMEFRELYLKELDNKKDFHMAINKLRSLVNKNKNIVLFDDCNLGIFCHLNILGEYLSANGFNIVSI